MFLRVRKILKILVKMQEALQIGPLSITEKEEERNLRYSCNKYHNIKLLSFDFFLLTEKLLPGVFLC